LRRQKHLLLAECSFQDCGGGVAIAGVRPLFLSGSVDLASNQATVGYGGAVCTVTALEGAVKVASTSTVATCAVAASASSSPFMMELLPGAIVTVRLKLSSKMSFRGEMSFMR
jgi:hypothetical protein